MDIINNNLKSMYYVQIDMGKSMGSLAQRTVELIKGNVKMLDWAMTATSNKKKNSIYKSHHF